MSAVSIALVSGKSIKIAMRAAVRGEINVCSLLFTFSYRPISDQPEKISNKKNTVHYFQIEILPVGCCSVVVEQQVG